MNFTGVWLESGLVASLEGGQEQELLSGGDGETSAGTERDGQPDDAPDDGTPGPGDDDGAEDTEQADDLPKDVQYDILKNSRRRLVLRYLLEEETPVSLGTLSEHVASVETGKEPRMLDSQERKRAYVGLYQCHLPRMDGADVIDFNKDRGLVELGPHAESVIAHLEDDDESGERWPMIYLPVSLVGLGFILLTQSTLVGPTWLGPFVAALTMLSVALIAAYQLYGGDAED